MPRKDRQKRNEYARKYNKNWRDKNPDKYKEYQKRWKENHPEYMKNYSKNYNKKNRSKIRLRLQLWREKNREEINRKDREYFSNLKLEVLIHYGGNPPKCACCGEDHIIFLSIDHIHNDGAEQRKKIGIKGGNMFYRWLKQNHFPEGYQVLCFNCNWAKSHGGCPHQEVK